MPCVLRFFLVFVLSATCFHSAQAETNYLGIKGGRMMVPFDDTSNANPFGFVAGHAFDEHLSLEATYLKGTPVYSVGKASQTIDPDTGDLVVTYSANYARDKLTARAITLTVNYRGEGEWYWLAKGGIANNSMKSNATVKGISSTNLTASLGFGWRLSDEFSFEFEASHLHKDLTYIGISGIMLGF